MKRNDLLTRILAIAGTTLVWLPLLAPLLLSIPGLVRGGRLHFDYLMPAELFPVALAGGCALLWAALRARARRGIIGWSLGLAVVLPVAGMALAAVTGLASGRIEPTGWQWGLVLAALAGYCLALAALGIGGVLLLRDLRPRSM